MKVNVDVRDTNTIVYDDILLKTATANEVVKLTIKKDNNLLRSITNIIGNSINLSESEKELYHIIIDMIRTNNCDNADCVSIKELIDNATNVYDKTVTTYKRVIDVLITKGIIKYKANRNGRDYIAVNRQYDMSYLVGDSTKYIVIEVADNVVL